MYTLNKDNVMVMVYKIFGEIHDDKKDDNLSLRVSKETRNLPLCQRDVYTYQ